MKSPYIKISNLYFLCICINFVVLSSCKEDWLDVKSDKSLTVPANLMDLQGLMDNPNFMVRAYPTLTQTASDSYFVTDAVFQSAILGLYRNDAYCWTKTMSHTNVDDWTNSYAKVLYDNVVLEGLNKIKPDASDQLHWNDIKGQALFNRARIFFELQQTYGMPYNVMTASRDLGIVMRLSSDITVPSRRNSVQETYDQILKDLKEAKGLLPTRPKVLTRASASAVNALLARVYLSMEDYENAFVASDDCLRQYSELLDYNDISAAASVIGLYNKEVLLHTSFSPGPGHSVAANNLVDQSFFDSYKKDDLRKTRFYKLNNNQTISFKGTYDAVATNYFNGLATDEVYLTRAECYARAGKINEAMKDLNDLIVKRWDKNSPYIPFVANSNKDALHHILIERKKELFFRGVRWMDLRRLNGDAEFAVTLKRTVLGTEYTLEPKSYKYTFPIPDDIIEQTGIQQNPGWP